MHARELVKTAMRRLPTDRIPCMPQLCHDTAVRLLPGERGRDWIDRLGACIEDPGLVYDYVIRLVEQVNCDGMRLFLKPEPVTVRRSADELTAVDRKTGERIGRVDIMGGGGVVPDKPPPPVETIAEVRERLAAMVGEVSDEKVALLRAARDRVADRFVATAPGGITMNTYTALRGREQAMIDFLERPQFVKEVMMLQAEAVIRRAERLLPAGVDALYIGDPSASASLISPAHFERFCLPAYQAFCRHFRHTDILIYIHICGNSRPLLEMMADSGAHVVEPLDPLGGVSVADAKRRIGGRVALMGGVNTLTLARGRPEEVRQAAIRACREGGPTGYVLAAGDMVPPETPLANLQALVDVSLESQWRER